MDTFKRHFNHNYGEELKQREALLRKLMDKILNSKRLLHDHMEALVECLKRDKDYSGTLMLYDDTTSVPEPQKPKNELFTIRNACLLFGSTILEKYILHKSLKFLLIPSVIISTGFGTACAVKSFFIFRNKLVEKQLELLLISIEYFANCIRKNMMYFNEKLVVRSQEFVNNTENERAWDCISSIKTVTEILYEATRKLEADYKIPNRFSQYYSPMEELKDCDYFKHNVTDYAPKNIKEFYNIFAYVQSQFLFRLALTFCTKPSLSELYTELGKVDNLIKQITQEEDSYFMNLILDQSKRPPIEKTSSNEVRSLQTHSNPFLELERSTTNLSTHMVMSSVNCQALDKILLHMTRFKNDPKHLSEVDELMKSIESSLSVCVDDFQHLMIVYQKYLQSLDKTGANNRKELEAPEVAMQNPNDDGDSILRVEIFNSNPDSKQKDDFYAYMYDENAGQVDEEKDLSKTQKAEMEILNFEKRMTKNKFRPVLKQLKDKIDPIRQDMLEKEKEALAAKGFNVDELFKHLETNELLNDLIETDNESEAKDQQDNKEEKEVRIREVQSEDEHSDDSVGSADLEYEKRIKKLKDRDNYAEMRNFLVQKQIINILNLDKNLPPTAATGEEEILENSLVINGLTLSILMFLPFSLTFLVIFLIILDI